ncbi:MAG: glutaredoxin 3 [Pseudobdellovibrionaceae bacterium]
MMAKIEIYTWSTCPYCRRAKALLDSKDVDYTEYDITGDEEARAKMVERTGGPRSVPQIFIDNELIGGCDDLHALEEMGKLDPMIAA